MVKFWAKVKSNTFHVKLLWLIFGQFLETFGLHFNSASGHSERQRELLLLEELFVMMMMTTTKREFIITDVDDSSTYL